MTQHYWYVATWMQRDIRDGDPNLPVWLPQRADIVAPNKTEAAYLLKSCYIPQETPIIYMSIAKFGTEHEYLVSQEDIELDFKKLDPFGNV